MERRYIKVVAIFNEDGSILPTTIIWEDDRKFTIDKVLDVRKIANLKYGAIGTRYICRIQGRDISIYNEDNNKWFMV